MGRVYGRVFIREAGENLWIGAQTPQSKGVTPEEFVTLIRVTLLDVVAAGRISIDPSLVPDPVTVEHPCVREHGD